MGNTSSSSSRSHDESVDFGLLTPQGVYTGPKDWNQAIVTQLICARKLAPFYRPLEDYDDSWTDDQILAARKELPDSEQPDSPPARSEPPTAASISSRSGKRPSNLKEPSKPEAAVYRGAAECPICFLYYPPNINHSRCCDQAICTECFVQIKRSEPTTTHLVSEPAACPYCVQDNFGVVYTPPPWRAGIGSEGSPSPRSDSPKHPQQSIDHPPPTHKRRQKSFSADSPEVVTTDQIRPDWEAKLAAVRAAVTRRANRRIIMRQVGDRLIPVGVTSGRVHALSPEEAAAVAENGVSGGGGASWRSRRRQQGASGGNSIEQYLGQDLEELMMMEAMRLSLIDHEAHQRKEAEEKKKAEAAQAKDGTADDASGSAGESSSSAANPNSIDLSSPGPSSSTSSEPVATHHKSDSLQVKRGSIFSRSRSRSPSPGPVSKPGSLPTPAPFSTLGAALSTTSTASAIFGSSSTSNSALASESMPSATSSSKETTPTPGPLTIDFTSHPTPSIITEPVVLSPETESASVSRSSTITIEPYEALLSSPDELSSEPLLVKVHEPVEGNGESTVNLSD